MGWEGGHPFFPVVCKRTPVRSGRKPDMKSHRMYFRILVWIAALAALPLTGRAAPLQGGGYGRGMGEGGRRAPMSADEQLKRMTKDLKLTSDQQSKIKPILADQQKKMDDLRNDSSL